jgi:hypothetical protein
MIHRKIVLACIALCVVATVAHGQFQVVHSTPNTTSTPQYVPVILSDGSLVTNHSIEGNHIIRKYDSAGTLVWSRKIEGYNIGSGYDDGSFTTISDGAGGTWSARLVGVEHYDVSSIEPFNWMDSLVQHFHVWHTNGEGEIVNATSLKKHHQPTDDDVTGYLKALDIAATPDGGLVLCVVTDADLATTDLIKLDANAAFLWSRSVGDATFALTLDRPTFNYALSPRRGSVAASPNGTIYYMEGGDFGASDELRLAGLDQNGNLSWMNQYDYGNTPNLVIYEDLAVDTQGNAHVAGTLATSVGTFHILAKVAHQGQMQRVDLYRSPLGAFYSRLGIDDQGKRYHLVLGQPPLNLGIHGILIADTLGNTARFVRRNDVLVLPESISIHPQRLAVSGGRIAFTGLLNHEHVDLGYTTRYEALASFAPDAIAPCLMEDTAYAHIPVPIDPVMTTTSLTTAASIDVSAFYSAEPVTIDWTSSPLEEVNDLCSFASSLMNLNVDVNEPQVGADTRLIVNSLVTPGQPVLLNTAIDGVLEIFDARGGRVDRVRMNGQRTLDTSAWAAGMYTLVITDGITQHSERFILE